MVPLRSLTLPIIVVDSTGEVRVFADLDDAAGYMEAVDVEAGEFRVYDAAGQVLRPVPLEDDRSVLIQQLPSAPSRPDELAELLRTELSWIAASRGTPEPEAIEHATSIEQLLELRASLPAHPFIAFGHAAAETISRWLDRVLHRRR